LQHPEEKEHNSNETTTTSTSNARIAASSSATPTVGAAGGGVSGAPTPPKSLALNRNHHYAPGSDTSGDQEEELLDSRYECAICIDWLNEPVLTSCGHRFCRSCLTAWMQKNNQCCPMDNKRLSAEHDIFPDNYTRREIEQLKRDCPN